MAVPATLHEIRMKVLGDAQLAETEREQTLRNAAARIFDPESGARHARKTAA